MRPSTTESLGWWSLWLAVGAVASAVPFLSAGSPLKWVPFAAAGMSMTLATVTHARAARGGHSQWLPVMVATAALAIVVGAAAFIVFGILSMDTVGGD